MSKEILAIVDTVSNEKQIDRDKVFNALVAVYGKFAGDASPDEHKLGTGLPSL